MELKISEDMLLKSQKTTNCFKLGGLLLFDGCLTSQQHDSVSRGQICSDSCTCCHTKLEVVIKISLSHSHSIPTPGKPVHTQGRRLNRQAKRAVKLGAKIPQTQRWRGGVAEAGRGEVVWKGSTQNSFHWSVYCNLL